ncbi:hypothetical protein [Streptomyces sp. NPDC001380]|uniref:hypothetical protein n=1 Tax=Streptomyces sp. NPDC001380 TaxID=3364566 RepID=UPI0036980DCA
MNPQQTQDPARSADPRHAGPRHDDPRQAGVRPRAEIEHAHAALDAAAAGPDR